MITIETARLLIRDHLASDLTDMNALLGSRDEMYFLPELFCATLGDTRKNLAAALREQRARNRNKFYFAVTDRATCEYIGEVGYTIVERSPAGHRAHLGYFIKRNFWGRGITTEAVEAVLDFAFRSGGICRMTTGCIAANTASERVMVKNGFKKEAIFEKHVFHDGAWKDRVEYGLLRDAWYACGAAQ